MLKYAKRIKVSSGLKILKHNPVHFLRILFSTVRVLTLPDYRFLNGYSLPPENLLFEITNRCNLRCKMCWLWSKHGVGKAFSLKKELSTSEIKGIIDDVSKFKPIIYFIGGEPLVRKDMVDILDYTKKKKLICTLTTNGTLMDKSLAKRVVETGVDLITFSIDGDQEANDKIRGKGNFKKALKGLENVLERKRELPIVRINITVSENNYYKLSDIVKNLLSRIDAKKLDELKIQQLWFTDKKHAEAHKKVIKKNFAIETAGIDGYIYENKMDLKVLKRELEKLKCLGNAKIKFQPDYDPEKYYDLSVVFKKRCVRPWISASIKSNGDLILCPDYYLPEYILGNLKDMCFEKLWNSEKALKFRRILKKRKMFPGCKRCCGVS